MTSKKHNPAEPVSIHPDDLAPEAGKTNYAILRVTRRDIESMNTVGMISALHSFTDNESNFLGFRNRMVVSFDGYDDDPRQLCEIAEVRAFFSEVFSEWPHWLWFLVRGKHQFVTLFSLLCQVKVHSSAPGVAAFSFVDGNEIQARFLEMIDRCRPLLKMYGVSGKDEASCIESALAEFS